jgi:hypothetical protein
MKLVLGVTLVLALAGAQAASAGAEDGRKAGRKDAPRLLKDAVNAGTVDAAAFAAITDWILHEKEEKVAAGLVDLLGAVEPEIAAAGGARWNDTTRAVFALFAGVLRDAEGNRRRSGRDLDREIAALVAVAAPAVAQTLREIDPADQERLAALLTALGPMVKDLGPLFGADVSAAAREALEK